MEDFKVEVPEKFTEKGLMPFGVQLSKLRENHRFDIDGQEAKNKEILETLSPEDQAEFRRLDRTTNDAWQTWKAENEKIGDSGAPQSAAAPVQLSPAKLVDSAIAQLNEQLPDFFNSMANVDGQANVYHPDKLKEMRSNVRDEFEINLLEIGKKLHENALAFENDVVLRERHEMVAYHPEGDTQAATFESMKTNLFNLYSMQPAKINADYENALAAGDSRKIAFFEEFGPAILENSKHHQNHSPSMNASVQVNQQNRISAETRKAKDDLKHIGLIGKYGQSIVRGISSGNDYGAAMFALNTLVGNERLNTQQTRLFGARPRNSRVREALGV